MRQDRRGRVLRRAAMSVVAAAIASLAVANAGPADAALPKVAVSLQPSARSVTETETDQTIALNVHLSRRLSKAVTLELSTSTGSGPGFATAGEDFTLPARIVIPARARDAVVLVTIVGDTRQEPTERFDVVIKSATNAIVRAPAVTHITILDNDAPAVSPVRITVARVDTTSEPDELFIGWQVPPGFISTGFEISVSIAGGPPFLTATAGPDERSFRRLLVPGWNPGANVIATVRAVTDPPTPAAYAVVFFVVA